MISTARASSTDLVGRVIGKYEIVRLLGVGGMGRVYEGLNTTIGKRVALKFIERDEAASDAVARFQREAQAASAVESAHIVEIFDAGQSDDGMPFIVMELLRGEDLGHHIRRLGRLELSDALVIVAQILRGLHRAHEAGIVHRDLKPDNIFLLDRDDEQLFAKILDFGISKITRRGEGRSTTITQEGTVLGTPVYMSPEQAQALSDVDGRADLWSVGAILYECLSGRPPHSGGTYEQVIVNICMKDVDDIRMHNPVVPSEVANVIAKAMTRERVDRFQSARAFLDSLVAASAGVLSAGSFSTSDARKGRTPTPSAPVVQGPATLGAVSTVAAPPPSMPPARARTSADAKPGVYVGVAAVAVLLGAIAAVAMTTLGKGTDVPIAHGVVLEPLRPSTALAATTLGGTPSATTGPSAAILAPSATPEAPASAQATASASTGIASAVPSVRPPSTATQRTPPVPVPKGGVGGDLQLQTH